MLLFIQKYTHRKIHTQTHTFATAKCDVILGKQLILHGEMSVMALGPFAQFVFYQCFFCISLLFSLFFFYIFNYFCFKASSLFNVNYHNVDLTKVNSSCGSVRLTEQILLFYYVFGVNVQDKTHFCI